MRNSTGRCSRHAAPVCRSTVVLLVGFLSLAGGVGCSSAPFYSGASSSYGRDYGTAVSQIHVQPVLQIRECCTKLLISKTPKATWQACVSVFSQYPAILSQSTEGDTQVAVVLASGDVDHAAENRSRKCTFTEFRESWIVVGVAPAAVTGKSELLVAEMSPAGALSKDTPQCNVVLEAVQSQLRAENNWPWLVNARLPESHPRVVALQHKTSCSTGEKELMGKLSSWISKRMRSELVEVTCPDATTAVDAILNRLSQAAGQSDLELHAHLVASSTITAFVMPNGDVYVSTGLLDAMETPDQVAAILAPELVHRVNNDALDRMRARTSGQLGGNVLMLTAVAASMASQFVAPGNPTAALIRNVSLSGANTVARAGSDYMQNGWVTNYGEDVELHADSDGFQLLAAAGFDPHANYVVLDTLQKASHTKTMSNLTHTAASISKREENLRDAEAKTARYTN